MILRTGWHEGPAAAEPGPHLISFTAFEARRHADLPGVFRAALSLRARWGELDGAVGLWLWSKPLSRRAGSISLWRDEAALRAFVAWAPHREIIRRYRDRGTLRTFSWSGERADFRAHWGEADRA